MLLPLSEATLRKSIFQARVAAYEAASGAPKLVRQQKPGDETALRHFLFARSVPLLQLYRRIAMIVATGTRRFVDY